MGNQPKSDGADCRRRAKSLVDSLLRVFTIFKLYPTVNQYRRQSVAGLREDILSFIDVYGPLTLRIDKREIYYSDEVIYSEIGRTSDFVLNLYRDGLRQLELQQGMTLDELEKLLEILNE